MQIYQFGSVTLPASVPVWEDSPVADVRTLKTLGGHFNPYRGERAPVKLPRTITVSALALAATQSALGTAIDGWRGLIGARDRLWGRPYDTAQVDRWCWATLRQVTDRGTYKDRIYQKIDLIFDVESHWNGHAYGGAWSLDSGYLFDNGLYFDSTGNYVVGDDATPTLANAGNRMVTNCGITYTCNEAGGLASVKFTTQNCEWTIGPLANADVWIIDGGSRSVRKNGSGAYQYFTLTGNHASPHWFEIAPGGETVTLTGGGEFDTVQFTYNDGWL